MANITKMAKIAAIAWPHMFKNMAIFDVFSKNGQNADQQWKRNWKIWFLHEIMAKKRFGLNLWPFSLYFKVVLAEKWPLQRRHFPCEFRAHPYLFGIRRARGMGLDRVLIQIPTFNFFAPPSAYPGRAIFQPKRSQNTKEMAKISIQIIFRPLLCEGSKLLNSVFATDLHFVISLERHQKWSYCWT